MLLFRMLALILCTWLVLVRCTEEVDDRGCTQVQLREEAMCEDKEVEDCGVCQTTFARDCMILMKKVWVPHTYKICGSDKIARGNCLDGLRRSCTIR